MVAKFLYNILIYLLDFALIIASFFNSRAKKIIKGRKHWREDLESAIAKHGRNMLWFHCASLGEFEQGRPVIEKLKHQYPGIKILLTFYSPSGFEARKNYKYADAVLYLPADTRRNANLFIEILKPRIAVFVKYEFWYNYLDACRENNLILLSISSIFRTEQVFFKPWGKFFIKRLGNFTHIFVQDENSRSLLGKHGINNITVSGDTRFDRVYEISKDPLEIDKVDGFSNDADVMVLGSVWPSDMKILLPLINDDTINLKFILAPHIISEREIAGIQTSLAVSSGRFSDFSDGGDKKVMIIDNIGMLSSLYRYGRIAYVGGAFAEGLHNILEPAVFGLPVIFGDHPLNKKYMEVAGLINAGGGFAIHTSEELRSIVLRLLTDRDLYHSVATASATFVANNTGATGRIVGYMNKYTTG